MVGLILDSWKEIEPTLLENNHPFLENNLFKLSFIKKQLLSRKLLSFTNIQTELHGNHKPGKKHEAKRRKTDKLQLKTDKNPKTRTQMDENAIK